MQQYTDVDAKQQPSMMDVNSFMHYSFDMNAASDGGHVNGIDVAAPQLNNAYAALDDLWYQPSDTGEHVFLTSLPFNYPSFLDPVSPSSILSIFSALHFVVTPFRALLTDTLRSHQTSTVSMVP